MISCFSRHPLSRCHMWHSMAPDSLTRSALLKRSTKVSNWSFHVCLAAQKMTGTVCLCLPRQTAQTGSVPLAMDGVSYVEWDTKDAGIWESVRKERGRLGSEASACSLDGGERGLLEKLGALECMAFVAWYGVGV